MSLPSKRVLQHVVDVHCHPTDSTISHETMQNLDITICAMASRQSDQQLVRDLALQYPSKVIPCFGYHPWFSHFIAVQPFESKESHYRALFLDSSNKQPEDVFENLLFHLPEPRLLNDILSELRNNLGAFPDAMLGEVGLDRSFRIPIDYSASPRELTPFTIPLEHQLAIVEAQIELAIEMGRNVSFHSVKSQQATAALLTKMRDKHGRRWCNISIDMHSCGLSVETWRSIESVHTNVFLSTSIAINAKNSNLKRLIAACDQERILVESDYNNAEMTTEMTWEMLLMVAEVKGWRVEQDWDEVQNLGEKGAVQRLEENWVRFKHGGHPLAMKESKVTPAARV